MKETYADHTPEERAELEALYRGRPADWRAYWALPVGERPLIVPGRTWWRDLPLAWRETERPWKPTFGELVVITVAAAWVLLVVVWVIGRAINPRFLA